MTPLVVATCLLFGQLQNFGNAPDPEETKRGEKMVSQNEIVIAQNEKMLRQNRLATSIAKFALVVSLIALLISLWSTFHNR